MDIQHTSINHSDIFSSIESFLNFFTPKNVEGDERKKCSPYSLPFWHPMSMKGVGVIASCEKMEDGQLALVLGFPVNQNFPLDVSIANNWMRNEKFISSLEDFAAYFVNGTQFGTEDGYVVVTNGPKEFTWTFKEPKQTLCEECQGKEVTENEQ